MESRCDARALVRKRQCALRGDNDEMTKRWWLIVGAVAVAVARVYPSAVWAKHKRGEYAWITAALSDSSTARQSQAIKLINELTRRPAHYALPYRIGYNWLPLLLRDGHDATAAKLARHTILQEPGAAVLVGLCQTARVEALLALGKNRAALRNARSLFNVCPLGQTETALLLLQKCLQRVYPHGRKLIHLFIREQISGAAKAGVSCKVLSLIKINAKPYDAEINNLHGTTHWALVAKGNMLLMAGRVNRALGQMKLAEALDDNPAHYLTNATNVARAIKAVDGTVYRANQYMLTAAHRAALLGQ
jgi:hypothetical protein